MYIFTAIYKRAFIQMSIYLYKIVYININYVCIAFRSPRKTIPNCWLQVMKKDSAA